MFVVALAFAAALQSAPDAEAEAQVAAVLDRLNTASSAADGPAYFALFAPDARTELIDGVIIDMAPIGNPHMATVDRLHALMIGVEPDLTFLIDIAPETGLARATARAGTEMRFEEMGLEMQARMRAGFLALAGTQPRFRVVEGARAPAEVGADVLALARAHLGV